MRFLFVGPALCLRLRFLVGTSLALLKSPETNSSQGSGIISEAFMKKRRKPENCKYYPLCEPLKTLVGQLSLKLLNTYTDLLPKEAESVCSQCDDFQRKEMLGKAY